MAKRWGAWRIQSATWALLIVWIGLMLAIDFDDRNEGFASVGAGVILLGSAILQKALGLEAGIVMWAVGLTLTLIGLDDLLGTDDLPLLALIAVAFGLFLIARGTATKRLLLVILGAFVALSGLDNVLDRNDIPTTAILLVAFGFWLFARSIGAGRSRGGPPARRL